MRPLAPWAFATLVLLCALLLGCSQAWGSPPELYEDRARVLEAVPIEREVAEPVRVRRCKPPSPAHLTWLEPQLGDLRAGRRQLGLVDALLEDRRLQAEVEPTLGCRTVTTELLRRRVVGYRVRYRYDGRIHERTLDEHPGEWLRIRVRLDAR